MTLNAFGFDGTVDEKQWSALLRYHGEVAYKHGVVTGFDVTAGTGSGRPVNISLGTAVINGVLATSASTVTLSHAANSGSATRTDYVVLQADWTANTVVPAIVQGSSSSPPALTQTEGSIWQMPLARVAVRPSVTAILTSDITPCKPLPRTKAIVYTANLSSSGPIGPNANPQTLGSVSVVDPGWPYRLRIAAAARFGQSSGYGFVDVVSGGSTIAQGISAALSTGRAPAVAVGTSDVLTGARTVAMRMSANSMNSGDQLSLFGGASNSFTVEVVPA